MITRRDFIAGLAAGSVALGLNSSSWAATPLRVRSVRSGPWSSAGTWEGGQLPAAGCVVTVRPGHEVLYDVDSRVPVRMLHIQGRVVFARDRDTRLDVGLIKIGGVATEDGANFMAQRAPVPIPRPALLVGTPDQPIPVPHTALIRLVYFAGFDRDTLPAIECCGGRMELHGAPLSRTWVKLGAPVRRGDREVVLSGPVSGWREGDRIILTATTRQIINLKQPELDTFKESVRDLTQTEERFIAAITGARLMLDRPADFDHICSGPYRGEVANLSRNVIVESADPAARGHTMYHHGSAGSISYAEFRRLGKRGTLGRYMLHFHLVRDSMRGSSVIGASLWDSENRWLTVHGTDYLVVRDCVGYNSIGHGFFLEDGTEVFNVFDRNLAVQGRTGRPLPGQVLPFDHNSGSGFWWANSLNTFTRNVACECDVYGFRFDMQKTKAFDPVLAVPQSDGTRRKVDVRTLPFVEFADNESHCQRNHACNIGGFDINLAGGCGGVGPDARHPFIIRNMRVWDAHWSFHPFSPSLVVENYDIHDAAYGLWKPRFERHAYQRVHMEKISQHVILDATGDLPDLPWEPVDKDAEYPTKDLGPAAVFDLELPQRGFPAPLAPVDDLAPVVIVTHVSVQPRGGLKVRGTASDVGPIRTIQVAGHNAAALRPNFAEWEVTLPAANTLLVRAEDDAGNVSTHTIRQNEDGWTA